MKVVFISFDFPEYCVRLANGIAQDRDTRVLFFHPKRWVEPYVHLLSNSVERELFDHPRLRQPFRQFRMVTRLVRQIRNFNPDVVHFQLGHLWFNWALPLLGDHPLVMTAHDSSIHLGDAGAQKIPQWVFDNACYRAQERIVHAPQIKELLVQRLDIPLETVHVIPHVLLGDDIPLEKGDGGDPEILFFGRIWKYKGLEYLIRAEPLITSKVPRAKIIISGVGEDFDHFYRRMMVHPDRFIVHNEYVSDEKRAELFRRASVVVLPYIEASQSGVIPIAYRSGKPVVATTVGGLPDMVDHGRTGYLVRPHDANGLAEAIIPILQSEGLRRELGENGRRKINEVCAPEAVGRKTREVYRHAINGWSAAA